MGMVLLYALPYEFGSDCFDMLAVADACADDAIGDSVKVLGLVLGSGIGFIKYSQKTASKYLEQNRVWRKKMKK